uniref:Thiolase_N domain-containing protein n=1 Tax=Macrostomum lignano TaxID=282301 RepID=A0A1I8F8K9_9PLAT
SEGRVAADLSHISTQGGASAALTVAASLSDCLKGSRVVAMICIVTNPVNSTVPSQRRSSRSHNAYDPRRLFGVTTLDIVRSNAFVAEAKGCGRVQ